MPSEGDAAKSDEWQAEGLDLDAYLERIGHPERPDPDGEALRALHRAHVEAIPFENLDIVLGAGISLDLADIEAKLAGRARGGYCFEHGLLFAAALERLGYEVDRLLCRVGDREPPLPRTHMALRVRTAEGEQWLADVGFGAAIIDAIPWGEEGPHEQGGWSYRLMAAGPGVWRVEESAPEGWQTLYSFTEEPQHHSDFLVANHFTSTHPRSPFVGGPVVMHKEPERRLRLVGRELSILHPDGPADERRLEQDELIALLEDPIGIELSEEEAGAVIEGLPESEAD